MMPAAIENRNEVFITDHGSSRDSRSRALRVRRGAPAFALSAASASGWSGAARSSAAAGSSARRPAVLPGWAGLSARAVREGVCPEPAGEPPGRWDPSVRRVRAWGAAGRLARRRLGLVRSGRRTAGNGAPSLAAGSRSGRRRTSCHGWLDRSAGRCHAGPADSAHGQSDRSAHQESAEQRASWSHAGGGRLAAAAPATGGPCARRAWSARAFAVEPGASRPLPPCRGRRSAACRRDRLGLGPLAEPEPITQRLPRLGRRRRIPHRDGCAGWTVGRAIPRAASGSRAALSPREPMGRRPGIWSALAAAARCRAGRSGGPFVGVQLVRARGRAVGGWLRASAGGCGRGRTHRPAEWPAGPASWPPARAPPRRPSGAARVPVNEVRATILRPFVEQRRRAGHALGLIGAPDRCLCCPASVHSLSSSRTSLVDRLDTGGSELLSVADSSARQTEPLRQALPLLQLSRD